MDRSVEAEEGAAVLEFALVSSVLVVILFGIIQFGVAYHVRQGLQAAAREGARIASLPQTTGADVEARVLEAVSGFDTDPSNEQCPPVDVGSYCVTVTPDTIRPCDGARGRRVRVEAAYRTRIEIPMWASPEIVLTGEGVFLCEV